MTMNEIIVCNSKNMIGTQKHDLLMKVISYS